MTSITLVGSKCKSNLPGRVREVAFNRTGLFHIRRVLDVSGAIDHRPALVLRRGVRSLLKRSAQDLQDVHAIVEREW